MKKLLLILLFVFVFMITGCDGSGFIGESLIKINGKDTLYVGETYTYETAFNQTDSNQEIIWSSSDETKLTIDSKTGVALAIEETKEEGIFIYATAPDKPNIKGSKKVFIYKQDSTKPIYPDLQGYTITIAHSKSGLADIDPFLDQYNKEDKEYKQEAWREVEQDFNCKIEVKAYPASAEWGPSRWNYILKQAENKTSDYDFLTIPDSKLNVFVDGNALISLKDFYVLHGNNMMDETYIESGSYKNELYTFTPEKNNMYNVLYYNINLFNQLKEVNPNLIEPAQIFLDGNWTHSKFLEYCIEVQDTMALLYGDKGTAGLENQEYYAVSGWDVYLWTGLSSNDGEPIADIKNLQINITTPHKEQAADLIKELYVKRYADPLQARDQQVKSWNEGKALFNTGDLWFVRDEKRWPSDLWGENTQYGYVPWPRANDVSFEDIQVALGESGSSFVMPIGRNYEGYGEDCNPENIYWALTQVYYRTLVKMSEDDSLIESKVKYNANKYADSEASQKAYIYIQDLIKSGKSYFDPMVIPGNSIDALNEIPYGGYNRYTIKTALHYYITGKYETWKESIEVKVMEVTLKDLLSKRYGKE